jgi:cation transport regulator ChaB
MPYSKDNMPDAIKMLPSHAQDIFIAAFNNAYKEYNGDEARSNATAWASVKTKYKKEGDKWMAIDINNSEDYITDDVENFQESMMEKARLAQEARYKEYNIAVKDGGNITKPSEYADVPDSEFLDAVNYKYPVDTMEHALAADRYFGKPKNQEQYSTSEIAIINKKLDSVKKKFDIAQPMNHSEFSGFEDWVEIFKGGKQVDSNGVEHDGDSLIDNAINTFNPLVHEPPLRLDHKEGPAYGWVNELKSENKDGTKILYAKFKNIVPEVIDIVKNGMYKKRSSGFYPDGKLNHVAMLGASIPAVRGLENIKWEEQDIVVNFEQNSKEIKFSEIELKNKLEAQKSELEKEFNDKLNSQKKEFEDKIKNIQFEQDKKEIKFFLDDLLKIGKILPKNINGLQNFCESLLESGSFNFEDKLVSKLDYFKSFLSDKEPSTLFSEFDKNKDLLPENKDELISYLIKEKQKAGLNFREAFIEVQKEKPNLFIQ